MKLEMIDTHCHLYREYYDNIDEIVKSMEGTIIVSGCNKKSNGEVLELIKKYDNVYGTLGLQPEEIDDFTDDNLKFIEDNLTNKKIVGIGEIGLDYYYGKENKELQKKWFVKQIELANKYNKTVVIHSRDAALDTLNILKDKSKTKKILHCFSYSLEMALEFIKLDAKLGIGGVVTFNNASKLQNIVERIDLKDIVLETDSPYLAPVPYRGKINKPQNIYLVAQKIAELKDVSVEEVLNKTTENAKERFEL